MYVYLNPSDVARWYRALNDVEKQARLELNNHPKRCSMEYVTDVIENIASGRFSGGYADYVERYEEWKSKYGKRSGFWQLYGDLINRITHFRVTTNTAGTVAWMGGIPSNVMDSGGKSWFGEGNYGPPKPIAMYGYVMEFGGYYGKAGYHPERPMFTPTAVGYARRKWPKQGKESLSKIGSKWK